MAKKQEFRTIVNLPRALGKVTLALYQDDFMLSTIKNRHAIIRGVYLKIRQAEPERKVDDVVGELQGKSGYSRDAIFKILRAKQS